MERKEYFKYHLSELKRELRRLNVDWNRTVLAQAGCQRDKRFTLALSYGEERLIIEQKIAGVKTGIRFLKEMQKIK